MATRLLPHRLSIADDWIQLVPVTAAALRDAIFIDGRTNIWSGEPSRERLSDFVMANEGPAPAPRYIFHLAFCGSTFLTRLLTHPGRALVLREPKCIADVAKQKAAADAGGIELPSLKAVVDALNRNLSRPWAEDEAVVVKPTNWVNNILPELLQGRSARALFLFSSRERYLSAMFHGGGHRLFVALGAAQRLSTSDPSLAKLLAAAIAYDDQPLDRLARIATAAHEIQMRLFRSAVRQFELPQASWLDAAELRSAPLESARQAAGALDLEYPDGVLEENVAYWANRRSKDPEQPFSTVTEEAEIAASFEGASDSIGAALDWANSEFGAEQSRVAADAGW